MDFSWFYYGSSFDAYEYLGAHVVPEGVVFRTYAPNAKKISVILDNKKKEIPMKPVHDGRFWEVIVKNAAPGTVYKYRIYDKAGEWVDHCDPYGFGMELRPKFGSIVRDMNSYQFNDDQWLSGRNDHKNGPLNVFEVHLGSFRKPENRPDSWYNYEEMADILIPYLKENGYNYLEVMPLNEHPSDESWGYQSTGFFSPTSRYGTVDQLKAFVDKCHQNGIGVIMDGIYNHTHDANSSFNKIVPYYYYRYDSTGANTSASGCGNDTASERYMYGKFMVESAAYWVEEYHLDGLRFDLMGLHDVATMQEVESAVHAVNPKAIIYGEGWTMGATIDGSDQANQSNISKIKATCKGIGAVAVFNDAIRDGLKGSVFEKTGRGYINGATAVNVNKVIFGIKGGAGAGAGWSVTDSMVINYMSAHDNNTLWDKLLLSNPDASDDQRNKMNNLGAAIVMISKGTPFWQAGEEMLRTKGGDENSYKSSDAVNNIDWSVLKEGTREFTTFTYYKGLIQMRKAFDIFTDNGAQVINVEELGSGILVVTFDDGKGGQALALINPHNTGLPYTLEDEWNLVADETAAGAEVLARESGKVTVSGIGVRIYVNDKLAS